MSAFTVRVRVGANQVVYSTLGADSASVHMAAVDRFGLAAITVVPAKAA
jgi:hypothetical protein